MLYVCKDLAHVDHSITEHCDNEYICVTFKTKTKIVNVIIAYLPLQAPLDEKRLEGVSQPHSPPSLPTGYFNAHNQLWGTSHVNCRGRSLSTLSTMKLLPACAATLRAVV